MAEDECWRLETEGIAKFKAGEFHAALELLERAVALNTDDAFLYFNLALARARLGLLGPALDSLREGFSRGPADRPAVLLLESVAAAWYQQEGWRLPEPEARDFLAWIDKGIHGRGKNGSNTGLTADYIVTTGTIALAAGQSVGYRASLAMTPCDKGKAGFARNTGVPWVSDFKRDEGIENTVYSRPLLPDYQSMDVEGLLDFISEHQGEFSLPEKTEIHMWAYGIGKKAYDSSNYETAARVFELLASIEPANVAFLLQCGLAYRDSGDPTGIELSITYFKQILEIQPGNALAWHDLAVSYMMAGDFARELFCLLEARQSGHTNVDLGRIAFLRGVVAPQDPFA